MSCRFSHVKIGDLANEAGVSVSTLRAWEDRYGLLRPTRTEGGHRIYGDDDLRRIRAAQALVAAGATVASAARRVTQDPGAAPAAPPPVPSGPLTEDALRAALVATRSLIHASRPRQAAAALVAFVEEVGAAVVPAAEAGTGDDVFPIDLSFGTAPPVVAVADPLGVVRLKLEHLLPPLAEDARHVIMRLRREARKRSRSSTASRGG